MTVALLALGAILAGAGTRLAAGAFIGAAVLAAMEGGPLGPVVTWTAALAAGCVLLERGSVRRLGLAALGAAAVLAAGLADNGAVVGGLWVVGTAAAVLGVLGSDLRDLTSRPAQVRWALGLCMTDLLVLGAIASTAPGGFAGWPLTLGTPATALLLTSAGLRVLLAAGPRDPSGSAPGREDAVGLLVVRTQVLVGTSIAILAGGPGLARTAAIVGALGFAAAAFVPRLQLADIGAEVSLYAAAAAATALGWIPRGWGWGALAAGTLIHYLRLMVGRRTAGRWADTTLKSPGIGLPFLPVIAAVVGGALAIRGWTLLAVGLGTLGGLAGRALRQTPVTTRRGARAGRVTALAGALDDARGSIVVSLSFVGALWAGAMTLPRSVGSPPIGWPPAWAIAIVVVCGAVGSIVGGVVPGRRRPVRRPAEVAGDLPTPARAARVASAARAVASRAADLARRMPGGRGLVGRGLVDRGLVDRGPVMLAGAVGLLVLVAAGLWIAGLTRGFL